MQTTLLGLAIALILALAAALVGPLFVDWGTYRVLIEREASSLAGADVRVTGAIDARFLPSPRLVLHDIEVGTGNDKARAGALAIEFALGPLMRGEWRAAEMRLERPRVTLGLGADGRVQAPGMTIGFNPDALAIERLSIAEGTISLRDAASGTSVTLDGFWFNGEARSLVGPFKGEGAARVGGELYPYRLSTGRLGSDGTFKVHLNVDPVNHPLAIEVDGLVAPSAAPRFEGMLTLARPVAIAGRGTVQLTPPWRIGAKVRATTRSALLQNVEFIYVSEDKGLRLSGDAEFTFGKRPRFNGVLSGRSIDFDRLLARAGGTRLPPAAAFRQIAQWGGAAFRPSFPIELGVGIDQVTLGGSTVQNFRGDISSGAEGWSLDRFEFRAPGFTQVRLSGRLALGDNSVAFTGPAEIEARDPKALAAWLEGRGEIVPGDLRPLTLRGDITLGSERVAVEQLNAEFDRKTIAGRLVYDFPAGGKAARLEAELNAPELDIDAALGFGRALFAGSTLQRPHDMNISADIGRATVSGFTAQKASARIKVGGAGLLIDRLSIADLGGAAFSANGRIDLGQTSPQGSLRFDLDAPDPAPVVAVLAHFAPETAGVLAARAKAMAPAKLHGEFALEGVAPATQGKLTLNGSLGKVRVTLNGQGRVDPAAFTAGDIKLDGRLAADDGKMLMALLGLDRAVAADSDPGVLTLVARGPARGDMQIDAKLTAGGLEAGLRGHVKLFAGAPSLNLRASIPRANAAPLAPLGTNAALPVSYTGTIVLAGQNLTLGEIRARIGETNLRGRLAVKLEAVRRLQGTLEADDLEVAPVVAAMIGMSPASAGDKPEWKWSSEPFALRAFGQLEGQVAIKARRVALLPDLTAREWQLMLRLDRDAIAFDDIEGEVAGGELKAALAFRSTGDGLKAQARFALTGANAASVVASGPRPPINGKIGFFAEAEGTGLSPVALIGSLKGAGKITLADGEIAGLNPHAFDAVTRAVDQGLAVDAERISGVVNSALESGQLSIKRAEGAIAISAGQARLADVGVESEDAAVTISGTLDLIDGLVDGRVILSGTKEAAGSRPDIYMSLKGPISGPSRSVDVTALSGWLTLRAVENQAKKLQALERAAPKTEAVRPLPPPAAAGTSAPAQTATPHQAPAHSQTQTPASGPASRALSPVQSRPWAPAPDPEAAPILPPPLDIRPIPRPIGTVRSGAAR